MRALLLTRTTVLAAVGGILVGLAGVGGVGYLLHARPVLHVASSAQECVNAPDHVASLFSDDENTLIRISNLDYSSLRVLRVEPAATLPGMFDALLSLSSDSRRLAYVTASDELMDDARIQYVDVGSPDAVHPLVQVPSGLAPVRPAWSPGGDQLAYVTGHPLSAFRAAGFEVWSVRAGGSAPPQKVADLPLDVFAQGHTASLCFTSGGQIGLLEGVESALGQPGPSPLRSPVSAARTEPLPSASATPRNGPPCGVPVYSQNDPSWQSTIMQAGGDPIGGFGCALTSTAMLLNYYGAVLSPTDLNACLGAGADPIQWQSAPACTSGRVQGGVRADFSWEALDAFLGAGKPVIVGMLRGLTGTHFVVVTQGGGGVADAYSIADPWDGSTTKTLGTYTNVGYNPLWIVSFDGPGRSCARLVPSSGAPVQGVHDGGTYQNSVTVSVPNGGSGSTTVQQVPTPSPSPSPSPSASASAAASPTPTPTPTGTPAPTASAAPKPKPKPTPGPIVWHLHPGGKVTVSGEGIYQVFVCGGASSRCRIIKFTIDRTPPVLALQPLNPHVGPIHTMAYRPMATATGVVLDRPGRLRLAALDTLSGVANVEYQLDGSGWTPYSDDVSFVRTLVVPTVGTHTVSIRATDLASNVGEVDDLTFQVVDTTPSPSPSPTPTASATRRPPTAPPATPTPTPAPTTPPPPFSISASVSPSGSVTSFSCPVTFTFTAAITYTGSAEVSVPYVWLRSDGATQTTQTSVSFSGPGTQQVQTTWTLSTSLNTPFNGWEQVQLQTSPAVLSNMATFSLTCSIIP
jgi:hypothetical protein